MITTQNFQLKKLIYCFTLRTLSSQSIGPLQPVLVAENIKYCNLLFSRLVGCIITRAIAMLKWDSPVGIQTVWICEFFYTDHFVSKCLKLSSRPTDDSHVIMFLFLFICSWTIYEPVGFSLSYNIF